MNELNGQDAMSKKGGNVAFINKYKKKRRKNESLYVWIPLNRIKKYSRQCKCESKKKIKKKFVDSV